MNTSKLSAGASNRQRRCTARILYLAFSLQLGIATAHAAGSMTGWGANAFEQASVPQGLANVVAVAAGQSHSLALQSDGTLAGWGANGDGEATAPSVSGKVVAIAAGSNYSIALVSGGTVLGWGQLSGPQVGLSNVIAVAAGASHALALRSDGTVLSWGSQSNVPAAIRNVIAIAAGNGQSLALLADRTVIAWGDDSFGKAEVPAGLSNVVAIAAGGDHCLALRADGTIVGWGRNDYGQISIPAGLTNAIAIGGGALHSLALRADGTLVAWGDDSYGQVSATPSGSTYVGIACGAYHNLAIQGDGRPGIVVQPASQTIEHLQTASFEVMAVGAWPLSFQWRLSDADLPGATNSILVIPSVQPYNRGVYTVVVSNALGAVTSAPAVLTVGGLAPQLISSFQDTTAICGDSVTFQVQAKGPSPTVRLYYQWQFQGAPIDNATNTSLVLTNINPAQAGQYAVLITNYFGTIKPFRLAER